ncbi:MAG: EutN/CcmL family microcompartment protein [Acidobacteriota bacterium]
MRLCRVIGTVVATVKNASLEGKKILVCKPVDLDGNLYGKSFLALDAIGVGVGEDAFFVKSKEAAFAFPEKDLPTDATIVGILDRVNFRVPALQP